MTLETYILRLGAYGYTQYFMRSHFLLSQARLTFASATKTGVTMVKNKKHTPRESSSWKVAAYSQNSAHDEEETTTLTTW